MKWTIIIGLLILFFYQSSLNLSYADNAEVLPKGVYRTNIDSNFYFPIDERFNPDGKVEDVAVDYNVSLNSNIFPALASLDPFVPGLPTIGDSVVSFKYNFTIIDLGFQYGVTDRLSAGIRVPYWWVRNDIDARLDSTNANVGKNAAFACGAPFCPLSVPGTVPLTTEDVQSLLGNGLDVNNDGTIDISGFGFKRFETFSENGLSDIEAGFRYQFDIKTEAWRLAFTGGTRFPTGEVDDPDNLQDYARGDGTYDLLFRLNNDFIGIKNLVLNGTFRYDLQLPDKEVKRVPDDINRPITTNKEKVERDLGDIIELEGSGKYTLLKGFDISLLYKYGFKMKDRVSGSQGFAYQSLERETDYTEHVFIGGLSYTTLPLYIEKRFPLPITASVSYRNRFAGSNNVLKSQFIALGLQVFF